MKGLINYLLVVAYVMEPVSNAVNYISKQPYIPDMTTVKVVKV